MKNMLRPKWTALLGLIVVAAAPVAQCASAPTREYQAAQRSHADLERGRDLYATCSACHGPAGLGVDDGTVPAIGGQSLQVLLKQLVDYSNERRLDPRMQHFTATRHLQDAQAVADVAAYVHSLKPQWTSAPGSGEFLARGAAVYTRRCAACHGTAGEGVSAKGYPRLAGQHYAYLVRQMHDALEERRSNFSRRHTELFEAMDVTDITGIADFLSRSTTQAGAR